MGFVEMLHKIRNWKYFHLVTAGVYIVFGLLNLWYGGAVRYIISFSFFLVAVFFLIKKPNQK